MTRSVVMGALCGALALPHLVACERTAPPDGAAAAWRVVAPLELDGAQVAQRERAEAARDALFTALLGELQSALAGGDPASAIDVCSERAPALATETSERTGVRIGRTSWKLRNPANAPPSWAAPLVERRVETVTTLAGPGGALGVLLPIRVQSACLACHGPSASLSAPVRDALDRLYPDDRATGFAEGDLRGWFWVEVPRDSVAR